MLTKNKLFKLIDQTLLYIVLLPLYSFYKIFPKKMDLQKTPHKILIVKLSNFGDSLLAMMSVKALRQKFPHTEIVALTSQRTKIVFERSPYIDRVINLAVSGTGGLGEFKKIFALIALFYKLKTENFEILLDYDVYYRFTTLFAFIAGSHYSAGFATAKKRTGLYHHAAQRPKDQQEYLCFFNIVSPLGVSSQSVQLPLDFKITNDEKNKADQIIKATPQGKIKIGVTAGSSANWPEKMWGKAKYLEVMSKVSQTHNVQFFLFGSPEEAELCDQLELEYNNSNLTNLAGKTSVATLIATVAQMDMYLSNDTGPMHLAALLNVPTVGVFGPTNEKKWTPPGHFTAVTNDIECRPCYYLSQMPDCAHINCLNQLPADKVYKAVIEKLAELDLGSEPKLRVV